MLVMNCCILAFHEDMEFLKEGQNVRYDPPEMFNLAYLMLKSCIISHSMLGMFVFIIKTSIVEYMSYNLSIS